jgi:succinate dehydrogenase / fumarate reductase membrane anchor subunit
MQRGTAVLLAVALPLLFAGWLVAAPANYAEWRGLFAATPIRLALSLTGVALALHAWVGVRDIFMDYIHPLGARLAMSGLVVLVLAATLLWLLALVWGVA